MSKLSSWWKEFSEKQKQSIDYKVESISMDIALQVYDFLNEKKLSQSNLAREMGVSRSYVSQILGGKPNMTLETLVKLTEALGASLEININRAAEAVPDREETSSVDRYIMIEYIDKLLSASASYLPVCPEKEPSQETEAKADSYERLGGLAI